VPPKVVLLTGGREEREKIHRKRQKGKRINKREGNEK